MGRFFFDVDDGFTRRDEIGRELDSDDAVRFEAFTIATRQSAAAGGETEGAALVVTVRDATDAVRLKARLVWQLSEH